MSKNKFAIAAAALAVCLTGPVAQASLTTVASGTANFGTTTSVSYDVVFDCSDSTYTYLYAFTPPAGGVFTLNASYVSGVLTKGQSEAGMPGVPLAPHTAALITTTGIFDSAASLISWSFASASPDQFVGFTSLIGPVNGQGSLTAGQGSLWDNNNTGAVPLAGPPSVPETSTIFAAAFTLIPLGIGVTRSLRKSRST